MKFNYHPRLTRMPETGELNIVLRPEIPVTIIGSEGEEELLCLLDTGADNSVLPKSVADRLGIVSEPCSGPSGAAFGGGALQFSFGQAAFRLESDEGQLAWTGSVLIYDFTVVDDEAIVLGHVGFLDFFRSTFDPEVGLIELHPNGLFPR